MYTKDKTKIISVRVSQETFDVLTTIKNQFGITPSMLCRQIFDGISKGYKMEGVKENVNKKINSK